MNDHFKIMRLSGELGSLLWTEELTKDLPWLSLPIGYSFKPIFPFCGAAARFRVRKDDRPEREISVYLDTRSVLGCCDEPYWEAYPIEGDTLRFPIAEGKELVEAIIRELATPESEAA